MLFEERIPSQFIQYAADILGDTNAGLSGTEIVKACVGYAVDFNVTIRHASYPFDTANKRTALHENLLAFSGPQQYRIISELCEHRSFGLKRSKLRNELKLRLVTRYGQFAGDEAANINETLIEETRHWLDGYPESLSLYNGALEKYRHGVFHRNLLDDLRLALEKLLRAVLENNKSLENQLSFLGSYIKERGGSKELANMFQKLVEYYASYQNTYVKHNDGVIEEEIEFIFEITSSFMKHLIRLDSEE